MQDAMHRHQLVAGISTHFDATFPQIAKEQSGARCTADFGGKEFRQISLCASLVYILKRLKKSFPFGGDSLCIAQTVEAHSRAPALAASLALVYPNKVQRAFEFFALKLICFALGAEPSPSAQSETARQFDALRAQSELAGYECGFVEARLVRPLLNDAGWQLFGARGCERVARFFREGKAPSLAAFADEIVRKLGEAPLESLCNLNEAPTRGDRKAIVFERFIKPNAAAAPKAQRRVAEPRQSAPRAFPAIKKPAQRSLKFCFKPEKLVERRRPFPRCDSLLDHSARQSLRELEGAAETCCSEPTNRVRICVTSCVELDCDDLNECSIDLDPRAEFF